MDSNNQISKISTKRYPQHELPPHVNPRRITLICKNQDLFNFEPKAITTIALFGDLTNETSEIQKALVDSGFAVVTCTSFTDLSFAVRHSSADLILLNCDDQAADYPEILAFSSQLASSNIQILLLKTQPKWDEVLDHQYLQINVA